MALVLDDFIGCQGRPFLELTSFEPTLVEPDNSEEKNKFIRRN